MSGLGRMHSMDALRGIVMIIMALDHVRDFFHVGAMSFQPDDLTRTTVALFFTRWITHICAPVFFFLAGVGACLWLARPGRTRAGLSRFLVTRGLWLIVLELTLVRLSFFFSLTNGPVLLTVLWALGLSMIVLAVLCWLPVRVLAVLSLAAIALHHLADPVRASGAWQVLHQQGVFLVGGVPFVVAYPLVPWFAVMSAGFCFGHVLRRKYMLTIGAAATVAFVVLRFANVYGDPVPWSDSALSFLRVTKYPPSLLFLLMTLGPALLLWGWLDRYKWSDVNPLVTIGRVPLFFFLTHFLVAHLLAIPFALVRYGEAGFLWQPMPSIGGSRELYPPNFGYSLPVVYLAWAMVVLLVYPLCVWFARLKQRRRDWWLSYL